MSGSRTESIFPILAQRPKVRLALIFILPVLAILAISPFVRGAVGRFPAQANLGTAEDPTWAGGLNAAKIQHVNAEQSANVGSASYTSGFDPAAEGLISPKPAQAAGRPAPLREARACADETNEKVGDPGHAATTGCNKTAKATAQPLPRPQAVKSMAVAADATAKPAPKSSNGFFGLAPHLPTTGQLLSPFTFVGDKVSGLFKHS